jgi:uncharacterized membrane protein
VNVSRRWWMILALIGVVVVALGLLVLAWSSQLIVSSSYLQVSGWTQGDGSYSADFLDHNATVGGITVIGSNLVTLGATEIPVTVSIWHDWGTDVKSVELVFSSNVLVPKVALSVLEGGPWPNVQFHRTSDGTGVLFKVADLGDMGKGTVTLGFFFEDYEQYNITYNIYFQLTLQNGAPFTFSNEVAETQVSIQYSRA